MKHFTTLTCSTFRPTEASRPRPDSADHNSGAHRASVPLPHVGGADPGAVRAFDAPAPQTFATPGGMLSLGMLTKAHFLFEVPLALGVVCWRLWRRKARPAAAATFSVALILIAGP